MNDEIEKFSVCCNLIMLNPYLVTFFSCS